MKVIVGYFGYMEKEIEIDDRFKPATTQNCDDDKLWESFYEEICQELGKITDYDEIRSIENSDNGYYIDF